MSTATVKTHLNRINIKLDTSNRVHIAVLVERAGVDSLGTSAAGH